MHQNRFDIQDPDYITKINQNVVPIFRLTVFV